MKLKTGIGFDAHKFENNRKLILGGIEIPFEMGLAGHSDADVVIHAIIDSLAGIALNKDIGNLFPDNDMAYKDIDSKILLEKTCKLIKEKGYTISNIDTEIIAQKPKLASYIPKMRKTLSEIINLDIDDISIKATTTEKMGFTGRGEGIAAISTALIIKDNN